VVLHGEETRVPGLNPHTGALSALQTVDSNKPQQSVCFQLFAAPHSPAGPQRFRTCGNWVCACIDDDVSIPHRVDHVNSSGLPRRHGKFILGCLTESNSYKSYKSSDSLFVEKKTSILRVIVLHRFHSPNGRINATRHRSRSV
jgi:hypothetical protein